MISQKGFLRAFKELTGYEAIPIGYQHPVFVHHRRQHRKYGFGNPYFSRVILVVQVQACKPGMDLANSVSSVTVSNGRALAAVEDADLRLLVLMPLATSLATRVFGHAQRLHVVDDFHGLETKTLE